jgi:hypothetical protein
MVGSTRNGLAATRVARGLCLWGATLAALAALVADCGGGENEAGGAGGPCATVYRGQCGTGCAGDDGACPAGLFCGDGVCTAQCTPEGGCDAGQTCSPRGRCVAGVGGGSGLGGGPSFPPGAPPGGGTSGGPGAGGGGNCPGVSVASQPVNPAVMLVIDRSASMACAIDSRAEVVNDCPGRDDPDAPESRWLSFKDPLLDVARDVQGGVILGAMFYPSNDACGTSSRPTVPLKLGNFDALRGKYDDFNPGGSTPTSDAIAKAAAHLTSAESKLPPNAPKFILLASDGSPHCEGNDFDAEQARSVSAVSDAFAAGVRTFVVAIGDLFQTVAEKRERFQALADAGAGAQAGGGKLYLATDREQLTKDLTALIGGLLPCSFDLDVALTNPAQDAPKGVVTLNGAPVPFDDPDGWKLVDGDTIEFVGKACTDLRAGAADVKASFPCDVQTTPSPITPPPR